MSTTPTPERRGVKFDPTVNLGHILTFGAMMASVIVSWSVLDKRILVLEEGRKVQAMVDQQQDTNNSMNMVRLNETVLSVNRGVEKISDRLEKLTDRMDKGGK